MSSRYANRVYAGRSFPNPVFAQCNQASCSSIRIELRLRRRPDFGIEAPGHFLFAAPTSYRDPAIEQIHFGKNDSSWSTNDKTTLILIFKIPCCNCTLPAANLHYFRRCSCGATESSSRLSRKIGWSTTTAVKRGMVRGEPVELDFPLRQRHIADATGLTPVHVSKVLSEFRRSGLIRLSERSLTILDLTGFRRIANMR